MAKRDYEEDHNKRKENIKKVGAFVESIVGQTGIKWHSFNIFQYTDGKGRGYDYYVELPPPPENKAVKCHTLEEAQTEEIKYYGKSELYKGSE